MHYTIDLMEIASIVGRKCRFTLGYNTPKFVNWDLITTLVDLGIERKSGCFFVVTSSGSARGCKGGKYPKNFVLPPPKKKKIL